MNSDRTLCKWLGQLTIQTFLVCVVALGRPVTAGAADVTVDCDGPGPANFGSISGALAALNAEGPNMISVLPGLCVENIAINGWERLTIEAPDGNVTIVPADPDRPVMEIWGSRSISLRGLSVDNSNRQGLIIYTSSEVRLEGMHANSNGTGGYLITDHSGVYFFAHATGNQGDGLTVAGNSFVFVEAATLTGNGAFGMQCRDGSTCQLDGNVVVENNGLRGLGAIHNSLIRVVSSTGPNTIQRNAGGISLSSNSTVVLTGPNGNSVSYNNGAGIAGDQSSNLVVNNSTVSNNSGPGISVLKHSVGGVLGSSTVRSNGGPNLKCDSTSLLHGDALGGIFRVDCRNVER